MKVVILEKKIYEVKRVNEFVDGAWVEVDSYPSLDYVDERAYSVVVDGEEVLKDAGWDEAKDFAETVIKEEPPVRIVKRVCHELEGRLRWDGTEWVEEGDLSLIDTYTDGEMYKVELEGKTMLEEADWQQAKAYAEELLSKEKKGTK